MRKFFKLLKYEIANNFITKWFFLSYIFFVFSIGIVNFIYINNLQFFYITFSKSFFINFDIDPIKLFIIPYSKIIYFIFGLYIPLIVYKLYSFEYKSGIYSIYIASKVNVYNIFYNKFLLIFLYYLFLLIFVTFFIIFVSFFFNIEFLQVVLFLFSFILLFFYIFLFFFLLMALLQFSVISIFLMVILLIVDFSYINFYDYFFSMTYGILNVYKLLIIFLVLLILTYFIAQILSRRFNIKFYIIPLIMVLFIAFISNRVLFYQFDLTQNKKYTLPDYLKKSLQSFRGKLSLFLFTSNENYKDRLLLKERFVNFRNRIEFNVINIDKYPSKAERFRIREYDNTVLIHKEDTIYLPFVDEKHFFESINYFLNKKKIEVLVLSKYSKYINFNDYLDNKLKMSNINLLNSHKLDKKICIIAGLKKRLNKNDVDNLMEYIKNGNNLIILNDPSNIEFVEPLIDEIGIKIDTTILKNNSKDMYSQDSYIVRVSSHGNFIKTKGLYYFPITSQILHQDKPYFSDILITYDSDKKDFVSVGIKYSNIGSLIYVNDTDFLRDSYINAGNNSQLLINLIYFINETGESYKTDNFSIKKDIPDNDTLFRRFVFFIILLPLLLVFCFVILFKRRRSI